MVFIQTRTVKYVAGILLGLGFAFVVNVASAQGVAGNAYLVKADTLFRKKQFTQSFELYEQLFAQGKYSPAMLLRMAYIQEGSGHVSKTLYYLTLYYKATGDDRVLAKIDELAANNHLEGYGVTPADRFFAFLDKYFVLIAGVLIAFVTLLMAVAFSQKRKRQPVRIILAGASVFIGVLFLLINFSEPAQHVITADTNTYLMSGPSAGANVVAIIPDGNKLRIIGKNDVWVRVEWGEGEGDVWVKSNSILKAEL